MTMNNLKWDQDQSKAGLETSTRHQPKTGEFQVADKLINLPATVAGKQRGEQRTESFHEKVNSVVKRTVGMTTGSTWRNPVNCQSVVSLKAPAAETVNRILCSGVFV